MVVIVKANQYMNMLLNGFGVGLKNVLWINVNETCFCYLKSTV